MKPSGILSVASLLSILFLTFHFSEEVARGMEDGGVKMLIPVLIMAIGLYGSLALAGRRSGYIIMLLVAIIGTGIPILHMSGAGLVGGKVAVDSNGAFFWVWGNIVLCTVSAFSVILAVRALWNPQWAQSSQKNHIP